jgi:hypothetical protein
VARFRKLAQENPAYEALGVLELANRVPPQISVEDALKAGGAVTVYHGTQMRGVSSAKAKRELNLQPRPLEWIADTAAAHGS